jgi:4-amino-4-deoxy-L-arabinose transferase-like glycosyltransferase
MKRFRWQSAPRQIPRHPFRDSAILYAVLGGVVVGVAAATGGNVRKAVIIVVIFFVVATAYSWWRWRERIRRGGGEK